MTSLTPVEQLREQPFGFDFFAALRWLECQTPERPRVGYARGLAEDIVRLGQDAALRFAPTALTSCQPDATSGRVRLGVAFLGLFGPNGALPLHLTEYALERERVHRDRAFAAFVDLFHQRFLSLFYRAWADAQPTVSHDRPGDDHFANHVAALCGLGLPSLRQRDAWPDAAKLYFAGRLTAAAKNAAGLEALLEGYFGVGAQVIEFVGEWLAIAAEERCRLGATPATGMLGETAVIGAFVYECQHRFRIRLGPLTRRQFDNLLPVGDGLPAVVAIVRNYVGDEYAWEVQPVLRRDEVPALRLGDGAARLGWTAWLCTRSEETDADDLIVDCCNPQ